MTFLCPRLTFLPTFSKEVLEREGKKQKQLEISREQSKPGCSRPEMKTVKAAIFFLSHVSDCEPNSKSSKNN